jgi:hypothetical protein
VIGKNDGWKQAVGLGKRTKHNFVLIPHARFIEMLEYKAELVGLQVIVSEKSYTSRCSFLALEPVGKQDASAGKRIKRGVFRAHDRRSLNADGKRRREWRLHHSAQRSPKRLWQWDRGCRRSPRHECPGE